MDDLRTAWNDFSDRIRDSIDLVFDEDQPSNDLDASEGVRNVLRTIQRAIHNHIENSQPERPEMGWTYPMKMGQDNPDGLYQVAAIDLTHTYRFSGNVGSVRYLGATLMTFNFGAGDIDQLLTINGSALPTDEHGNFEIYFSPDPPPRDVAAGSWFQLAPKTCRLMIRQFFSDWENETPADLNIECLDADAPSRMAATELIGRLDQAGREIVDMPPFWAAFAKGHLDRGEVNGFGHLLDTVNPAALGGSVEQAYGQCWYHIPPGEALIYEVTVPDCAYWGVQLGDVWYQSLDYVNHQSSLNGHQAVLDGGVFRAVISHEDPGVANWLDLAGSEQGCITYRWNQADTAPVPATRLVAFERLGEELPESTPRVSAATRRGILQRRRRAALARFRR